MANSVILEGTGDLGSHCAIRIPNKATTKSACRCLIVIFSVSSLQGNNDINQLAKGENTF